MDLMFNELSALPPAADTTEAYTRIHQMLCTFKKTGQYGYNKIRFEQRFDEIELGQGFSIKDFCNESKDRNLKALLMGLRRYPYIEDNSAEESQYLEKHYYINKNNDKIPCQGLAAAYLYSTAGIGFLSETFWNRVEFELIITNGASVREKVCCLSSEEHVDDPLFIQWQEEHWEITLVETALPPAQKRIQLRNDHGQDTLSAFATKIIKSSYVEEVVNSLPFNPHATKFIKAIRPGGLVEIVLTGTDQGLGLVIRTTGRNIRETTRIADLLKEEYDLR